MCAERRKGIWPASLRGRFTTAITLAMLLLFVVMYVAVTLVSGSGLWLESTHPATGILTPLLLGALAVAGGLIVANILTRAIGAPIESAVDYVRERGLAAIEGRPSDRTCAPDADLPTELEELCVTVDQLMQQLSLRQADIQSVTEQVLESEQAFRTVVEASSEAKLLLRGGIVEVANPAAAQLLRLPAGFLLGISLLDAFSEVAAMTESGEPVYPDSLMSLPDGEPLAAQFIAEDGTELWVECSVSRPKADTELVLLTLRDVTERHELEQLRSEIVSVVSHDLRAPITVVSGYLEMLQNESLYAAKGEEIIANAREATKRMTAMLEDLLDLARSGRGIASVRQSVVDLRTLTSDVAAALPAHPSHELTVAHRGVAIVTGDADRLRQALTNLLMNAIEHTPDGTRISLSVTAEDGQAQVIVEDEGSGVPAEKRRSIFERYVQGDDGSGKGAGLGLYIVSTVARSHGGRAFVEDSDEGGARFVLELPLLGPGSD